MMVFCYDRQITFMCHTNISQKVLFQFLNFKVHVQDYSENKNVCKKYKDDKPVLYKF